MRRKLGSIKYYKKQADIIFSKIIRARGACERCSSTNKLQCAHVIGRRNLYLRWDEMNALCLCYRCHIHWMHKQPLEFSEWFRTMFPANFSYLQGKKDRIVKRTRQDYKELVEWLKEMI